ncbi:protein serine/threonine phosphatase 2C [Stemphylium lycopersici]|nr:protein serine/threonine phosphatase 2C [Stemphylium lycopersici]
MATLSVPSPGLSSTSLGASIHRPLSTHGLPKQPRTMSSERPHRFSAKSYPPPALVHTPMTPQSLGPMSPPPMSAKSFGTFIDSEPSTPAYSPRIDHDWDNSSVVLVRPMSSSSEPSSPTEPVWRMLKPLPVKAPPKSKSTPVVPQTKTPAIASKEMLSDTSLASRATKETRHVSQPKPVTLADLSQQHYPPKSEDIDHDEEKKPGDQSAGTPTTAAFGKLASKMKLMLRRKNTKAKKEKKKRQYEEVDRIEDPRAASPCLLCAPPEGGFPPGRYPPSRERAIDKRTHRPLNLLGPQPSSGRRKSTKTSQNDTRAMCSSSSSIFRPQHSERIKRVHASSTSRALSQTPRHAFPSQTKAQQQKEKKKSPQHVFPPPSSGPAIHSIPHLQSRFPTKTVIVLALVGGLAYYLVDIVEPSWTDDVYAAFASTDTASSTATPLHFYRNREELQHTLDYHIPDPSLPLKDASIAKFFSDQFDKLCFGWKMEAADAEKGVEGMPEASMPITHGCRFRSNEPCEDFFALGTSPGPGDRSWNYWAVLDGHAGQYTAAYLQWCLLPMVSSALATLPRNASSVTVENVVKNAFVNVDRTIMERAKTAANWLPAANAAAVASLTPAFAGSCALLAAFDPDTSTLRVACTGDSRAVLGRWDSSTQSYTAVALSEDQTGFNEKEVARIRAEHPDEPDILDPKTGRLLGLAVTRAFGDHRWKWDQELVKACQHKFWGTSPRPLSKTPPYLTAEPEVTETQVVRQDKGGKSDFLILASDGLWDRISSAHAVECVARYLEARDRGNGSVANDPLLQPNIPDFSAAVSPSLSGLEPGVTCDPEASHDVDWKATPEYFAIEDENAAVCLARNAMGGTRRALFLGLLTAPEGLSRNAVDDTTIMVVFFDRVGEGKGPRGGQEPGTREAKKRWWWPL